MTSRVVQAGAIAIRRRGKLLEVLLVTARRDREQWIFPKGHVETDETAEEAAVRELLEEGAVVGEPLGSAGTIAFGSADLGFEVEYYLVRAVSESQAREKRDREWLEPRAARERLTFEDSRTLLDRALDLEREWRRRAKTTRGRSARRRAAAGARGRAGRAAHRGSGPRGR
jgi:8-oxo-dGTP pyrophosphatase MutT (NUDIX family)